MCSCTRPYPGAGPGVSVWGPQPIKSCTRGFRGSVLCASSSFLSDQSGHRGEESHFSGGRAIPAGCSRACQNAQLVLENEAAGDGLHSGLDLPSVALVSPLWVFPHRATFLCLWVGEQVPTVAWICALHTEHPACFSPLLYPLKPNS